MMRKRNKGLSMVEVVIALAIFMIMMIPIVSSLISSTKTTGTAKELQSRNEYAENLIETLKEVPIDVLATGRTSYFEKIGAEGVSITSLTGGEEGYLITGKTSLGAERTQYAYAVKMLSNGEYKDENKRTSGVVQDLDQNKVALISATLSNYDEVAYQDLLKTKLAKKQTMDGGAFNLEAAMNEFRMNVANRNIEIKVSKDLSNEYDVICTLYYSDDSSVKVDMVSYEVYKKHYKKVPDIYLMYNLCVYNEMYANEYITYDVSGVDVGTKVNVFVVETASDYSDSVRAADNANVASGGTSWLKGGADGLYQKAGGSDRDGVIINMAEVSSATGGSLQVYHNMYKKPADAADGEWNNHKKNVNVNSDGAAAAGTLFGKTYVAISGLKTMNEVQSGSSGLYEIEVWMQEGDSADMSKQPILQGTRGGGQK